MSYDPIPIRLLVSLFELGRGSLQESADAHSQLKRFVIGLVGSFFIGSANPGFNRGTGIFTMAFTPSKDHRRREREQKKLDKRMARDAAKADKRNAEIDAQAAAADAAEKAEKAAAEKAAEEERKAKEEAEFEAELEAERKALESGEN